MSFGFEARFFRGLLERAGIASRRLLVVGCGAGDEAGCVAAEVGGVVVALDRDVEARAKRPGLHLLRADARWLPFRARAFDALYCYHVLEHVPGPDAAVAEARRVLGGAGLAFFGTPNRSRLVGYAGGRATLGEKIRWNASDWRRRLTGRWSNEDGAHAGFTERELGGLLAGSFARVRNVSRAYYRGKYPGLEGLWQAAFGLGLARFLLPSVYFVATGADGVPGREETALAR